jgi:hypothetical protein
MAGFTDCGGLFLLRLVSHLADQKKFVSLLVLRSARRFVASFARLEITLLFLLNIEKIYLLRRHKPTRYGGMRLALLKSDP